MDSGLHFFRQAQLAEFEHIAHERIAAGEALTKESLNQIWYDLNVFCIMARI